MKMSPSARYVLLAFPVLMIAVAVVAMAAGQAGRILTITTADTTTGSLQANLTVGPLQPVCYANATTGPAVGAMASVKVILKSSAGLELSFPVSWQSNQCSAFSTVSTELSPGTYTLTLSSCCGMWTGVPHDFTITAGRTTTLHVNVDTGIR